MAKIKASSQIHYSRNVWHTMRYSILTFGGNRETKLHYLKQLGLLLLSRVVIERMPGLQLEKVRMEAAGPGRPTRGCAAPRQSRAT